MANLYLYDTHREKMISSIPVGDITTGTLVDEVLPWLRVNDALYGDLELAVADGWNYSREEEDCDPVITFVNRRDL